MFQAPFLFFQNIIFITCFYVVGSNYYVRILSTIDKELLKPNASVALHKHSNALVDILPPEADSSIAMLSADEKPNVSYSDIGGNFCSQLFIFIFYFFHAYTQNGSTVHKMILPY